jgi:hypothetical protein
MAVGAGGAALDGGRRASVRGVARVRPALTATAGRGVRLAPIF